MPGVNVSASTDRIWLVYMLLLFLLEHRRRQPYLERDCFTTTTTLQLFACSKTYSRERLFDPMAESSNSQRSLREEGNVGGRLSIWCYTGEKLTSTDLHGPGARTTPPPLEGGGEAAEPLVEGFWPRLGDVFPLIWQCSYSLYLFDSALRSPQHFSSPLFDNSHWQITGYSRRGSHSRGRGSNRRGEHNRLGGAR